MVWGDNPGPESRNWKGGRLMNDQGYVLVYAPGHPNAHKKYVREHVLIAEKVLGKILPSGVVIHHANENPSDNIPTNLVICQDKAYHKLLHARMRALRNCGHAHWIKCEYCGNYDDPKNMYARKVRRGGYHSACVNQYQKQVRNSK